VKSIVLGVMVVAGLTPGTVQLYGQNVGPGEQPFNYAIYKSSHNSYDRDESLARQIDDFNIWQLELDVYDYRGELKVNHNCDLVEIDLRADALGPLLEKMVRESTTYPWKFTLIYLDMKGNGESGCHVNWGSEIRDRLKAEFIQALGEEHIYPASALRQANWQWPSYQALVRQGYYWGVIVDFHGTTPNPGAAEEFLYYATSTHPPDPATVPDNTVLVNRDGGCDAGASRPPRRVRDQPRWLYRMWPGSCASDCLQMNGRYWTRGIEEGAGYNLLATNCVDWDHTFKAPTHSPALVFVDPEAEVSCPERYDACEWGTRAFPFHDLDPAIERASPMVTLLIQGGEYRVTRHGPRVIDRPVVLATSGTGSVILH
jgi:hypothetical protein